jgi:diaminopimelate epimerase
MNAITFTKLHGAENDFLITWRSELPPNLDLPSTARRICARTTGIGADGWMLAEKTGQGLKTRLFNSDGSEAEISGNGTRCAAALYLSQNPTNTKDVIIETGAGAKHLKLIQRNANIFQFEMNMGEPILEELHAELLLEGRRFDATVLNVGNPQCAIFVDQLPENWLSLAKAAEQHPRFPHRANVSFVRILGQHALDVVFFERGAGETRSSGTGSTGAAAAAILRGVSESPVEIKTIAGSLQIRWDENLFLTGPAEVIGEGRFFLEF